MVETVLFREGSSRLDDAARAALRDRAAALRVDPDIRVVIGGFTSQLRFSSHSMELALLRVQAVRDFVLSKGIVPTRIDVAIRGTGWFMVERTRSAGEVTLSSSCLLQIADPHWTLWRN
ncbi:MAG: OmpA family protein [Longimicrobiales bacterium]|nr:OmpA family protein [Longimicrobiales bacterium]